MLNINDQAFVTIKIDGTDLEYANVKNITLAEGNGVLAPTIKIEVDDPKSVLAKAHALSEGNTIEILIARSVKDTKAKPRKYRIFGVSRDNASYNANLSIVGVLDCPLYFVASARESHVGTSGSVLSAVASKCGLKYIGPGNGRTLNDKQIWLDVATTRSKFIFDVTRHGWMDSKSCMGSCVTSQHELRYKNLVDEINTPDSSIKFLLTHSTYDPKDKSKTHYITKEARDKSSAGLMATWTNYGTTRGSNNIDGVQKNMKDLSVHSPGVALAINKEVIDEVKRVRFDYSPLDSTNTHKEYQNALYQNIKLSALFTETMSLLVTDVTDIQLFDLLVYRQADADPKSKVRNEDKYLVTGKTIVIRGGIHYAERLQCTRMSLTMTGQAPMASNMQDTSVPSLVPESSINIRAIGSGLASLNGIKSLSEGVSFMDGISVMMGNGMFGSISSLTDVFSGVSAVKDLLSQTGVLDTTILSAIGSLARSVDTAGANLDLIRSASSALTNATSSVLSSLSPQFQELKLAEEIASVAYVAAEQANIKINQKHSEMLVAQKLSIQAEKAGVGLTGAAKAAADIKAAAAKEVYQAAAKEVSKEAAAQQPVIAAAETAREKVAVVQATAASPGAKPAAVVAAETKAVPALTAAAAANVLIKTADTKANDAKKVWKDLQAEVAAAPQGPARAALIARTQAAYNDYYAAAGAAADVAQANKAAVDAGINAQAAISAAQRVAAKAAEDSLSTKGGSALASAALSKPGGCIDGVATSLKTIASHKEALVEVWSLVGWTPQKFMVSPEVKKLMDSQTAANDRCKAVMAQGVKTANLVMAAVNKITPPNPMPEGHSESMAALSVLIKTPGVTQGQISQFLHNLHAKHNPGALSGKMKPAAWIYYRDISIAWGTSFVYDDSVVKPQ